MKLFLKACGVPDVFRLKIEDRTRSDTLERTYSHPFALIGRNPDTDLTLDHWQVSRRHSYVQILQGRLFCLDLGSRTGTLWEGRPSRSKWLSLQQTVHVGPFRIACESIDPSTPLVDEMGEVRPPSTEGMPGARLEPIDDPSLGVWQMDEALALLGRSPACDVRLPDPTLSKFHASLVRTPLGVWVVDLLGTSGIQVNRRRLRCSRLADGDELAIGQHRFRLYYDDPQAFDGLVDEAPVEFAGTELARRNHGGWLSPQQGQPPMPWDSNAQPPSLSLENRGMPESVMMVQAMLAPMLNQFAVMQQQMFEQFHQTMIAMIQSMQVVNRDRMDMIQKELNEVHRLTKELHSLQVEASRAKEAPPAPPPPIAHPAGPVRVVGSSVTKTPPPAEPQRPAEKASTPKSERPLPKHSHVDVHATLHQRITNLQSERQTRWQKILGMVGKQTD